MTMERCRSGLTGRSRKAVWRKRYRGFESLSLHQINYAPGGCILFGGVEGPDPYFAKQKGFGVAIEKKMWLHFFVNERRKPQAAIPLLPTLPPTLL